MKIAVYHNLPNGGAKRLILDLLFELQRRNHNVTLFTSTNGFNKYKLSHQKNKINVINLSWLNPKSTKDYLKLLFFNISKKTKELADQIDNSSFDFLILGGDWITNTSSLPLYLKTPTVLIAHELKREFYEQTEFNKPKIFKQFIWKIITKKLKQLEIKSLNNSNLIIVNSIYSLKNFNKLINLNHNIEIIYPFISKNFLNEKTNKTKKNYYLIIGNNLYLKGINFIIKAISESKLSERINLKVVSSSPKVKKYLNKAKINYKIFTHISDQKLIDFYKNAKALLFFSKKEPFGLVPLEALILGCPVFAINEGGFTELSLKSKNIKLLPRNKKIIITEIMKHEIQEKYANDKVFIRKIKRSNNVKNYTDMILDSAKKIQ